MKPCCICGETKPLADFKNRPDARDGKRSDCRDCTRAREAERRKQPEAWAQILDAQRTRRKRNYDPAITRVQYLWRTYRLVSETYDDMLAAQGGRCAICGSDNDGKPLVVDHDHSCCPSNTRTCGRCVRELLCGPCNTGLGAARDDTDILSKMIDYLNRTAVNLNA